MRIVSISVIALMMAWIGATACTISAENLSFVSVQFHGATGWIIGGTIYLSTDGGEHWSRVDKDCREDDDFPPLELRKRVQFVDGSNGFLSFSRILEKTTDSGQTWIRTGLQPVYALFFRDKLFGFINDASGKMHRTRDGGESWEPIGQLHIGDVAFLQNKEIYAIRSQRLLRSTDEGNSWVLVRELPKRPVHIKVVDGDIWVVGQDGFCGFYNSSAATFRDFSIPPELLGPQGSLFDIASTQDSVIAVGSAGAVFLSRKNGPKWERVGQNIKEDLISIDVAHDGTAFIVGGTPIPPVIFSPRNVVLTSKDYHTWQKLTLAQLNRPNSGPSAARSACTNGAATRKRAALQTDEADRQPLRVQSTATTATEPRYVSERQGCDQFTSSADLRFCSEVIRAGLSMLPICFVSLACRSLTLRGSGWTEPPPTERRPASVNQKQIPSKPSQRIGPGAF